MRVRPSTEARASFNQWLEGRESTEGVATNSDRSSSEGEPRMSPASAAKANALELYKKACADTLSPERRSLDSNGVDQQGIKWGGKSSVSHWNFKGKSAEENGRFTSCVGRHQKPQTLTEKQKREARVGLSSTPVHSWHKSTDTCRPRSRFVKKPTVTEIPSNVIVGDVQSWSASQKNRRFPVGKGKKPTNMTQSQLRDVRSTSAKKSTKSCDMSRKVKSWSNSRSTSPKTISRPGCGSLNRVQALNRSAFFPKQNVSKPAFKSTTTTKLVTLGGRWS